MNRVLAFDDERGLITVEGGIEWPELIGHLNRASKAGTAMGDRSEADRRRSAQHRRRPVVQRSRARPESQTDCQPGRAFDLIGPTARSARCSRTEHPELFRLAIGGYGLFGVISRVELRLRPRVKVRRVVVARRDDGDHRAIRRADPRRLSLRRLPVRHRLEPRQLSVSGHLLLLPAGRRSTRRSPNIRRASTPRTGRA